MVWGTCLICSFQPYLLLLFFGFVVVVCASYPKELADTLLASLRNCTLVLLPMKAHAQRGTSEKYAHINRTMFLYLTFMHTQISVTKGHPTNFPKIIPVLCNSGHLFMGTVFSAVGNIQVGNMAWNNLMRDSARVDLIQAFSKAPGQGKEETKKNVFPQV